MDIDGVISGLKHEREQMDRLIRLIEQALSTKHRPKSRQAVDILASQAIQVLLGK